MKVLDCVSHSSKNEYKLASGSHLAQLQIAILLLHDGSFT